MTHTLSEIKAKIAKVLRLQQSKNAGEAANAAALVEKLCSEYELSPSEISADYDPEKDEVIEFGFGRMFRKQDTAFNMLIGGVVSYFNGRTIITHVGDPLENRIKAANGHTARRQLHIIATKANKIQIELYADWLIDEMERQADQAKSQNLLEANEKNAGSPPQFRGNFRKGFANELAKRLIAMRKEQERRGQPDLQMEALAVVNRNSLARNAVNKVLNDKYPRRRAGAKFSKGYGFSKGSEAAKKVGLNKQTTGSKTSPTLALTGS